MRAAPPIRGGLFRLDGALGAAQDAVLLASRLRGIGKPRAVVHDEARAKPVRVRRPPP